MALRAQRFLTSRMRWLVFGAILVVSVYLLAVTPVQTWIDQRHQVQQAEQRYRTLDAANKKLDERVTQLQSDAEIERLAREQYELVPPGAQAYAVMPPPAAPVAPRSDHHEGLWSKVWDKVTFWN